MRGVLGLVSLLLVLAIVALAARNQLRATTVRLDPAAGGASSAAVILAPAASQPVVQQMQRDLARSLQQGADRARDDDGTAAPARQPEGGDEHR